LEVIWLLRRLTPDDKTIADFRKDNGPAIKKVCARFVDLCRQLGLLRTASVAIDGSKFKAVNTRDKTKRRRRFDLAKMPRGNAVRGEPEREGVSAPNAAHHSEGVRQHAVDQRGLNSSCDIPRGFARRDQRAYKLPRARSARAP